MKCPFCSIEYHDEPKIRFTFLEPVEGKPLASKEFLNCDVIEKHCPACQKTNISLRRFDKKMLLSAPLTVAYVSDVREIKKLFDEETLIYPRSENRAFSSLAIPENVLKDFTEACYVLRDSPKASAALSRRCLQTILREKAKVSPGELFFEIQEILDRNELPSYLRESIDTIRKVGNIAAHSLKSKSTGSIVDVESGEAELSISVLEGLLDFYYILPEKQKERITMIDKKYEDTDKKPKKSHVI